MGKTSTISVTIDGANATINGKYISSSITMPSSGTKVTSSIIPTGSILGTLTYEPAKPAKPKTIYKCAYCGTFHDHRTGICDRCGASLGEAEVVQE